MTAGGPKPADQLGVVLPHEHVFMSLVREYRGDGLLNDYPLAVQELTDFARNGGGAIVDTTTRGLNPHHAQAAKAASEAGIDIVFGCGFYRDPYLEGPWLDEHDADQTAAVLIDEIEHGINGTDLRAGIIGEIGADRWYISAKEERSFRAAARAQLHTGLTITTHAARYPVGLPQLDLLEAEGVSAGRVIIGHCDTVPDTGYHLALAERGVFVQFDTIRLDSEYDLDLRVGYVKNLVDRGHEDKVLLSHDVCLRSHLKAIGGGGYTLLFDQFIPRLRKAGIAESTITRLTQTNPQRALVGE